MGRYLLIASEDPYERRDAERLRELALQLRRRENEVTLLLVQNAVLCARPTSRPTPLLEVLNASVEVLADEFSLRERGIGVSALQTGVRATSLALVVDRMADGWKTVWK